MGKLESFFRSASASVRGALPDHAVVVFELSGDGGGAWTVTREGDDVRVRAGTAAFADTRLSCTVEDFLALVEGRLSSRRGFLDGRFGVEGDVGLVMRLEQSILAARNR